MKNAFINVSADGFPGGISPGEGAGIEFARGPGGGAVSRGPGGGGGGITRADPFNGIKPVLC